MLMNWLRKHQRKILAFVMAGFLISTFVGFGLYITSGKSHFDTVAEVNSEKIPYQRFNALYNQAVMMKRNNKEDVNADTLKSMRQEVVQGLIQESVFYQEADRYGFIVVAPELTAFDFIFGEFPLHSINRAFKSDELTTLRSWTTSTRPPTPTPAASCRRAGRPAATWPTTC